LWLAGQHSYICRNGDEYGHEYQRHHPDRAGGCGGADPRNREAVGRLISRVLRPRSGPSALARAIAELKLEARAAGLTDAEIDGELAAYNAERRD
jgi:hypothetical protein